MVRLSVSEKMPKNYFRKRKIGKMTNFGAKRFRLNLINLKGGLMGKIWESCRWGDNRKWLPETDPNLITKPPPYTITVIA